MLSSIITKLITEPVGNNLTNRQEDVRRVKRAFSSMKRFEEPEENGYMTRELDTSIRSFQRDLGLREDGLLYPGGETETTIKRALNAVPFFGVRIALNDGEGEEGSDDGDSDEGAGNAPPPPPPRKPPPPEDEGGDENEDEGEGEGEGEGEETECSDLEVKVANASGAFVIAEQNLNMAKIQLQDLETRLKELNEKFQKEKETGRDMRFTGGIAGGLIGAVAGGVLGAPGGPAASAGGAMVLGGRGIGSTGAVVGEEIGDEISGEGSLIRIEIQQAALKKEIKALKERITVLQAEWSKAKFKLHQAQQELHLCQKNQK